MFSLFKYKTPTTHAQEFEDRYIFLNLKQVKSLSITLLFIALLVRIIGTIYHQELASLPRIENYNLSNILQIIGSTGFVLLSHFAIKWQGSKKVWRNFVILLFVMHLLLITFSISYIYSSHNLKNTLTVFLVGIIVASIFFTLKFKHALSITGFILLLSLTGALVSEIDFGQKLANLIAGTILAFVFYSCSRYTYFLRSQQFTQIKQLEEKNGEIEKLNREKSEILGFVAHDLRSPLNNIEALSTLVLAEGQESGTTELQLILASAQHAKDIINDLIEVVQEKKPDFKKEDIDLVSYLQHVCNTWQANVDKSRKINFFTSDAELFASINTSKFSRVVDNLIGNGIKFSAAETPINIELVPNKEHCDISIRDYGIGIPEELKKLLFDQFSKAGRVGLNGEKSMGLGLHISREIIELHGGTLKVESKEHEGTTFTISVPRIERY